MNFNYGFQVNHTFTFEEAISLFERLVMVGFPSLNYYHFSAEKYEAIIKSQNNKGKEKNEKKTQREIQTQRRQIFCEQHTSRTKKEANLMQRKSTAPLKG